MTASRVTALRQQILRSVRASDGDDPAEVVKKWLRGRGYSTEAENFDLNDYRSLKMVEAIIIGEFCPDLLSA
jgi:hypothetical protein